MAAPRASLAMLALMILFLDTLLVVNCIIGNPISQVDVLSVRTVCCPKERGFTDGLWNMQDELF